jgi:hypothetical protein
MSRKTAEPKPLDLFFMLVDCCMPRLSPNAWKIVSYVAAQHLRVHSELLEKIRNPLMFALKMDLERYGLVDVPNGSGERPYRADQRAPTLPGGGGIGRFATISLDEICRGKRSKAGWRDYGTGVSKSTVAAAIKEALQSGILVREHHKSSAGRDLPSYYAIDWDRVQEYDSLRRKSRKQLSQIRTPILGEDTTNKSAR